MGEDTGKNASKAESSTEMVLLADDEETVRLVGGQMIERLGLEPILAAGGEEALELFERDRDGIACVLLDLTMPGMSGEQTFDSLKEIDPDVQVVLCSGYNENDATQHFKGKGLAGFLQKPFTMRTLKEKLDLVLGADDGG